MYESLRVKHVWHVQIKHVLNMFDVWSWLTKLHVDFLRWIMRWMCFCVWLRLRINVDFLRVFVSLKTSLFLNDFWWNQRFARWLCQTCKTKCLYNMLKLNALWHWQKINVYTFDFSCIITHMHMIIHKQQQQRINAIRYDVQRVVWSKTEIEIMKNENDIHSIERIKNINDHIRSLQHEIKIHDSYRLCTIQIREQITYQLNMIKIINNAWKIKLWKQHNMKI